MKKLILLLVLAILTEMLFSQWQWQNPLPQGNALSDICFINQTKGWAVGDVGCVLRTEDNGLTWELQNSGTHFNLCGVEFIDDNNGWSIGWIQHTYYDPDGIMIRTEDGGETWYQDYDGDALYDIHFANPFMGWAVGDNGNIIHTNDGGEDWNAQESGMVITLNGVYFADENNGWVVGHWGKILHTVNSGSNWDEQTSGVSVSLTSVFFVNPSTGYICGEEGVILKTINGGNSWSILPSGTIKSINCIHFTNEDIGWVVGSDGVILTTTNGGNTWTPEEFEYNYDLSSVFFNSYDDGFILGEFGFLSMTNDSGTSWEEISSGTTNSDFDGIYFVNNSKGWVSGEHGIIMHTSNGGDDWIIQMQDSSTWIHELFFINEQEGWTVGDFAVIQHTTDGGENWEIQYIDSSFQLVDVLFVSNQIGWAVGSKLEFDTTSQYQGIILKTVNAGETWVKDSVVIGLKSIHFINMQKGWVAGSGPTDYTDEVAAIYRTNDGGNSWDLLQYWDNYNIEDIQFINTEVGFVVGASQGEPWPQGMISRTTDGGQNWGLVWTHNGAFTSICFPDTLHGWATISDRKYPLYASLVVTNDGGYSWNLQQNPGRGFLEVFFIDEEKGWLIGGAGKILHTDNGGVITKIQKPIISNTKGILSIYPNPSTRLTMIDFQLESDENVTLLVQNINGQNLKNIALGVRKNGKFELDCSNYSSGTYIISLKTDSEIMTEKLIIE